MPHPAVAFFLVVLHAVLPALFIVASTAFVMIPQAVGNHPGEARSASSPAFSYHPT